MPDKPTRIDSQSGQACVGVCHGPRCGDYGGRALAEQLIDSGIRVERLDCQSLCPHAPIVRVEGIAKLKANMAKVLESLF